mmetsp:Transcript_10430/g.8959  ORF Transcript_10430/g.8959 Transcript_10430/m.8959 type:complete len:123 (+) Transcript_10430:1112-1480(+)
MDSMNEFFPQMEASYRSRDRFLGFGGKNFYQLLRLLTALISITLNVILIVTYKHDGDDIVIEDRFENALYVLNVIQVVIAAILVVMWIKLYAGQHISLMWERFVIENRKEDGPMTPVLERKI